MKKLAVIAAVATASVLVVAYSTISTTRKPASSAMKSAENEKASAAKEESSVTADNLQLLFNSFQAMPFVFTSPPLAAKSINQDIDPDAFFNGKRREDSKQLTTSSFTKDDWLGLLEVYVTRKGLIRSVKADLKSKAIESQSEGKTDTVLRYPFVLEVACRTGMYSDEELIETLNDPKLDLSPLFGEACWCLFNLLPAAEQRSSHSRQLTLEIAKNPYFTDEEVKEVAVKEGLNPRSCALIAFQAERTDLFKLWYRKVKGEDGVDEHVQLIVDICNVLGAASAVQMQMLDPLGSGLLGDLSSDTELARRVRQIFTERAAGKPVNEDDLSQDPIVAELVFKLLFK